MFFVGLELLLVELLALDASRVVLELAEVGVLVLVGLGGVMRHLRELRFLFCHIGPLKFLYDLLLFLLVPGKHHQEIFDVLSLIEPTVDFFLDKARIHAEELIAKSAHQQLLDDLLVLQVNLLNLNNAGVIIICDPLLELLLLLLHFILIAAQAGNVLVEEGRRLLLVLVDDHAVVVDDHRSLVLVDDHRGIKAVARLNFAEDLAFPEVSAFSTTLCVVLVVDDGLCARF